MMLKDTVFKQSQVTTIFAGTEYIIKHQAPDKTISSKIGDII